MLARATVACQLHLLLSAPMKIATYKDGSRDGQLVVVSRDLTLAHYATAIVGRTQQLLDDWNFLSPQLDELSQTLNHGKARHAFAFDAALCMAPLPRSHCVAMPDPLLADRRQPVPELVIVRGDGLLGARDALPLPSPSRAGSVGDDNAAASLASLDFCAQLAVITGDLAADSAADDALASIRLVGLAGSWHRSGADQPRRADPWGCISFAPVAVTPDELGAAWDHGSIDLALQENRGGKRFSRGRTAGETGWSIGDLLAACSRRGALRAGSIVCTGATAGDGAAYTPLAEPPGIEAIGCDGSSMFGVIEPTSDRPH